MRPLFKILLVAALPPFLGACRENDLGTGANTVDREITRPAREVLFAARKSVEGADLKISSNAHDDLGGEIVARRAEGGEVRIRVKSLDERSSRISVRVEPGDRALALVLQERIAERLGLGAADEGWFGGDVVQARYLLDVETCLSGARRTFHRLEVSVTDEQNHVVKASLDGRLKDSTPVRIRMERVNESETRVLFVAGSERSEDTRAFAARMKKEFEALTRGQDAGP